MKSKSTTHFDFFCPYRARRFYKFVENAYSHANRTLLQLLLRDQQLIPRLRSLKRYFFLSQSSFLNHFLDLASTEVRKSPSKASVVKLQSLLDLALNADGNGGEDALFREDIKVTLAESGLYDFLSKVIAVSGVQGHEGIDEEPKKEKEKEKEKEKDDKKGACLFSFVPEPAKGDYVDF